MDNIWNFKTFDRTVFLILNKDKELINIMANAICSICCKEITVKIWQKFILYIFSYFILIQNIKTLNKNNAI